MTTMTIKPKKAVYVIRVADRKTGEQMDFDITARSVQEAESRAMGAGWLVVDPTSEPEATPSAEVIEAKMRERAVMFGVLKALGIAAAVVIGLVVVGNIVFFLAAQ